MDTTRSTQDLLAYLITQANSGQKNWFGFQQQKLVGINACYEMAIIHADKMTPEEVVQYVSKLNNAIYNILIKGDNT